MGQIRVHVSNPGITVPETGILTRPTPEISNGSSSTNLYFGLGIAVSILLVIVFCCVFYKRWKKQGLTRLQLISRSLLLAMTSFGLTFLALVFVQNSTENILGASTNSELAVSVDDVDIYVELGDEPVYKTASGTITVNQATTVGYTLSAYTSSSDLISTTDDNNIIPGIIATEPSVLSDNTWGISLTTPDSKDSAVWQTLSVAEQNALMLKDIIGNTSVGDCTTVYYGVYVTPDTPAGTYVTTVNYNAHPYLIMQEADEWGSSVEEGQEVFAIDTRDNAKYSVARLKDGNLWMTQNLDLGRTDLTTDLTSDNTNLATTITADEFNSWKETSGTSTYDAGELILLDGTDETSQTPYGTLYNYYATSAGTISGDNNTSNATYDICPAGWRLPTGGDSGEFRSLYTEYNSNALMRAPIADGRAAFALAGYFSSSTPAGQGSHGIYWSSTRGSNTLMYLLSINTLSVYPANVSYRYFGYAIRCVLKTPPTISDLTYMQDFNGLSDSDKASVLDSMEDSTVYTLIDNRDSKSYAIAKLKDGNVWMTENLDLGRTELTIDLTSNNTNMSTTVAADTFNSWKKASGTETYDDGEYISLDGTDETSQTPYGTLYNYFAASAGTISGDSNNSDSIYDICPAGWRLPTGGSSGEFIALYEQYNSNALMRAPIEDGGAAFALAGNFGGGIPSNYGSFGVYWSSTSVGPTDMRGLGLFASDVYADGGATRVYGLAVRCVLKTL